MVKKQKTCKDSGRRSERGSALWMVLTGITLLAALNFAVTQMTRSGGSERILSEDRAKLYAHEIVGYAGQIAKRFEEARSWNTTPDNLDFMVPSDPDFDTTPVIYKVYHPQGLDVPYQRQLKERLVDDSVSGPGPGWYFADNTNIGWSPTVDSEVVLTAYGIDSLVCEMINKDLAGTRTIPVLQNGKTLDAVFVTGGTALLAGDCPACENYYKYCVQGTDGVYGYYHVMMDR